MTDFKKYIRSASFRGVPFEVRDDNYSGGRRVDTHEYPGGERAMTEDLGRKAYEITFTAFVNGQDWQRQTDALIAALEQRGPGTLIHPNGKTYIVNVTSFSSRSDTKLFETSFDLSFIESGEQPSPMPTIALSDRMVAAAKTLDIASAIEFAKMKIPAISFAAAAVVNVAQSFVANARGIVDALQDGADAISGAIDDIVDVTIELSKLADDTANLLRTPNVWAARVQAVKDIIASIMPALPRSVQKSIAVADDGANLDNVLITTDLGAQQYAATRATRNFNRATATSMAAQVLVNIRARRRYEVQDMLDTITGNISEVLNSDIAMAPEFTIALSDLAAEVARVCNDIIRNLPEETEVTLATVRPARVMAWDLYGDPARADEICTENGIKNPTFVPAGTAIRVLAQ